MSENPYEAPHTDSTVVGVLSGTRDDLRGVARFQKGILVCILIQLIALGGQFAVPADVRPMIGWGIMITGMERNPNLPAAQRLT